ncbi:hypothetical protein D3C71_1529560 [compost metagenome]
MVTILKPALRSEATASGAGASMKSTWPERSAATRALASGIGSRISLAALGMRAAFQYLSLRTSTARSRWLKLSIFHGPVPTALLA